IVEPSVVRFATAPGLVSNKSPGMMAVESAASLPLTHTPPWARKIAGPASSARSDAGKMTIIVQQTRKRKIDTLIPTTDFDDTFGKCNWGSRRRLLALWMTLQSEVTTVKWAFGNLRGSVRSCACEL